LVPAVEAVTAMETVETVEEAMVDELCSQFSSVLFRHGFSWV
jgi:hypothetical protein